EELRRVLLELVADPIHLLAHVLVALEELGERGAASEQAAQQAGPASRVEAAGIEAAQGRDHRTERAAGGVGVLLAHAVEHAVGQLRQLLLRAAAEEQHRARVGDVDLGEQRVELRALVGLGGGVANGAAALVARLAARLRLAHVTPSRRSWCSNTST